MTFSPLIKQLDSIKIYANGEGASRSAPTWPLCV